MKNTIEHPLLEIVCSAIVYTWFYSWDIFVQVRCFIFRDSYSDALAAAIVKSEKRVARMEVYKRWIEDLKRRHGL